MWFHSRELKLHDTDKASSLVAEYVGDSRRTMGAQRSARLWLGAAIVLLSASSFAGARVSLPTLSVQPAPIATRSACAQSDMLEESNKRAGEPGEQDPESGVWRALYALAPVALSPSCMHRSQAEHALRDALARLQSTTLIRSSHPFRQVAAFDGRYAIGLDTTGQLHWAERFGQYPPRALPGLTSDVKAFAVSPDGRRLVAGTADGQLVLWELCGPDDPLRRNTVAAHRRGVSALAFSSDGTWLASADEDGEVQLRSVGENLSEHTHQRFTAPAKQIDSLSVHAETSTVFAIGGSRAFAWTWSGAATARPAELRTPSPISALAFSADGSSVIAGSSDGTIHLWSAPHGPRGPLRIRGAGAKIQAVAASSVAPRVALSIDQDGILRITELDKDKVREGELPTTIVGTALAEGVDLLLVSSDGMHALAREQSGTLYAWDLANREKKKLGRLDGNSTDVKLADDGSWALTGDPQTLRAWDLLSFGSGAKSAIAHQEEVTAMALSSERMLLVTGGRDQRVRLWRLSPAGVPTLQHTLPVDAAVRALVLDDAGRTAVVASGSRLLIWDLTQCTTHGQCSEVEERELSRSDARLPLLTRLAMSPDGQWLVAGDEAGHVATWSLSLSGSERVSATRELGAAIRSLAIDPVRRLAAAGTSRGDLWVWPLDLSRDPERVSLSPGKTIRDLAFHDDPDGGIVAGADDFKLYEVPLTTSGQPTTSTEDVRKSYRHDDAVVSVAAVGGWAASGSQDGQIYMRLEKKERHLLPNLSSHLARLQLSKAAELLVASDKDGFLTLWPLSDEQAPSPLRIHAHQGPVNTFAIDQRGEFIVTGGDEGKIRVWPLSPARLIEHACTVVGSAPSPELPTKLADEVTELCGGA
jgi:WD40 repeat protein